MSQLEIITHCCCPNNLFPPWATARGVVIGYAKDSHNPPGKRSQLRLQTHFSNDFNRFQFNFGWAYRRFSLENLCRVTCRTFTFVLAKVFYAPKCTLDGWWRRTGRGWGAAAHQIVALVSCYASCKFSSGIFYLVRVGLVFSLFVTLIALLIFSFTICTL
jgi:hypothetical protein